MKTTKRPYFILISRRFVRWRVDCTILAKLRLTFVAELEKLELATFFKIWEIVRYFLDLRHGFLKAYKLALL
jgi:hypothetical protein